MILITPKKKIKYQGISIRDKLKNIAKKEKKQVNLVYLAYIFERFLYRVYNSKYGDKLILKGGVRLYCEDFNIRQTVDIDFLGQNISNEKANIKKIFQEICAISIDDPIIFYGDRISIEESMNLQEYGGFKIKIPYSFVTSEVVTSNEILQIDIGFNDEIYPHAITIAYPLFMDKFKSFAITGYPIEAYIAEKIHSIYFLGDFNSRMKDYYDLYKLCELIKLETITLLEAIKVTFERRRTTISIEDLLSVLNDDSLEKAFQRYCKKMDLNPIKFNDITLRLKSFFLPIFEMIENNTSKYKKTWNPQSLQWE